MLRKFLISLMCLLPVPALAQGQPGGQEQIIQLIINITQGSPSTPGHVGYLTLAERNLQAATEAAEAAFVASDSESIRRNLDAVILSLDPPDDFKGSTQGFVRSVAGIAGNAAFAAQMPGASGNVVLQAKRINESADNVIEWSHLAIQLIEQSAQMSEEAKLRQTAKIIQAHINRIQHGADANKDGTIGWEIGEGGFDQLSDNIAQLAGGEGLMGVAP